jgi:hypothetical protein
VLSRIELEKKAFWLILNACDEDLLPVEMWKRLGLDSREGSRIALKFEKMGVVERQRVSLGGGRWTYRLISLRKPVTIDSIWGCPCAACNDMDR